MIMSGIDNAYKHAAVTNQIFIIEQHESLSWRCPL